MKQWAIDKLTDYATRYLIWVEERSLRDAPICLDCDSPEPRCYCDERDAEQDRMRDAFDAGWNEAVEWL